MQDIKHGSSKDDLDYAKIYNRVVDLGILPEGHPDLNSWCSVMNKELAEDLEKPYCYPLPPNPTGAEESTELWNKDEIPTLKILKL